jgi:hypothetical protein
VTEPARQTIFENQKSWGFQSEKSTFLKQFQKGIRPQKTTVLCAFVKRVFHFESLPKPAPIHNSASDDLARKKPLENAPQAPSLTPEISY